MSYNTAYSYAIMQIYIFFFISTTLSLMENKTAAK